MQQNVSNQERFISMALGSYLLSRGLFGRNKASRIMEGAAGAGLLLRGITGFCPAYFSLGREPLHSPKFVERSVVIDKPLEEVREIIGEGDPLWYESSRKIFPITAGNLLWDLHMEEIGDGQLTLIRASLSQQNEAFGLRTRLSHKGLKDLADQELHRLKSLMESEYDKPRAQPISEPDKLH